MANIISIKLLLKLKQFSFPILLLNSICNTSLLASQQKLNIYGPYFNFNVEIPENWYHETNHLEANGLRFALIKKNRSFRNTEAFIYFSSVPRSKYNIDSIISNTINNYINVGADDISVYKLEDKVFGSNKFHRYNFFQTNLNNFETVSYLIANDSINIFVLNSFSEENLINHMKDYYSVLKSYSIR